MVTIGAAGTAVAVTGASGHADAARQAIIPAAANGQLLSYLRASKADGPGGGAGNGQGHGNGNGDQHSQHGQGGGPQGQGPGDQGQGAQGQGNRQGDGQGNGNGNGNGQGNQPQGQGQPGPGDHGQGNQPQGNRNGNGNGNSNGNGNGQGSGQWPTGDGRHRRHGHGQGQGDGQGNGNGQGNQPQGSGDQGNGSSGPQASAQGPIGDPSKSRLPGPRDRQHSPRHPGDSGQGSGQTPTPTPAPAPAPAPAPPVVVVPTPPASPPAKPAPKRHPAARHRRATPVRRHETHPAPSINRGLAGSLATLGASAASRGNTVAPAHAAATTDSATASGHRHKPSSHHATSGGGFTSTIFQGPITRLVKFIPGAVWLALAVSIGLALLGMGAALFFRRREVRQAGRMAEVETAALTDPLTGALNRRGFAQAVERELARSRRYGRPFVLAYADVRGLKSVNDSEGHLAGDQLLCAVATVLGDSARAHDVVGRLGGDEFALMLPEQSAEDVGTVIERICDHLQAAREDLGFQSYWGLTVGAAAFPVDGESFDDLLAVADRRLYEKRGIELLAGAQ